MNSFYEYCEYINDCEKKGINLFATLPIGSWFKRNEINDILIRKTACCGGVTENGLFIPVHSLQKVEKIA